MSDMKAQRLQEALQIPNGCQWSANAAGVTWLGLRQEALQIPSVCDSRGAWHLEFPDC